MSAKNSGYRLLVYTHEPDKYDVDGLARSVHFAIKAGEGPYRPLFQDYGILFAEATIDAEDILHPKCAKHPYVFAGRQGWGIAAVRVEEDGSPDTEAAGHFLLWETADFVTFTGPRLIALPTSSMAEAVRVAFDRARDAYVVTCTDAEGETHTAVTTDWQQALALCPDAAPVPPHEQETLREGVVCGNSVAIDDACAMDVMARWDKPKMTGISCPQETAAASAEELAAVRARASFADGSTCDKAVLWDASAVDWSTPGRYTVHGRMKPPVTKFPLTKGYADPVLFQWEGRWYFLSTNEHTGNVGLFIRGADTVAGLFAEDVQIHQLLDVDEAHDFIQTFWAPEFHRIGGEAYILLAIGGKVWSPQCHAMRLKKGADPLLAESWETPRRIRRADGAFLSADGITLDMTYLSAGGQGYYIWSYRRHIGTDRDTGSMLMIARMDEADPCHLASDPVLLSRPLYGWENAHHTINNEGPYAFIWNDTVYLAHSGGSAAGYLYTVGFHTASVHADLTDVACWDKEIVPAMCYTQHEDRFGCGHNSFFRNEDGELMVAYHAAPAMDSNDRDTGMHRIHFDAAGRPRLDLSPRDDTCPGTDDLTMTVIVR